MIVLAGTEAEVRLVRAWDTIFSQDPTTQQIIHVLAPPSEYPEWLAGFSPFAAWIQNGCEASEKVWQMFADLARQWPYIRNARRAAAVGIANIRICVLKRAEWESAPSWLRYLVEVHLPAISAMTGEALYRVWLEDCESFGIPPRNCDVNLYGASGVMIAGYENGDVSWRAFLADDPDSDQSREEHGFIFAMRDFVFTCGERVKLPEVQ